MPHRNFSAYACHWFLRRTRAFSEIYNEITDMSRKWWKLGYVIKIKRIYIHQSRFCKYSLYNHLIYSTPNRQFKTCLISPHCSDSAPKQSLSNLRLRMHINTIKWDSHTIWQFRFYNLPSLWMSTIQLALQFLEAPPYRNARENWVTISDIVFLTVGNQSPSWKFSSFLLIITDKVHFEV